MPKRHHISAEEVELIKMAKRKNKDKTVDRWLCVLLLQADGTNRSSISKLTGFQPQYITELVGEYVRKGLEAFVTKGYKGNRRNMSQEEEAVLLESFAKLAETGQIVETSEIKAAYEEKVGHIIGKGQIYRVLARHNWRKVKPRSRHPKKATPEVIETSKKLTLESRK